MQRTPHGNLGSKLNSSNGVGSSEEGRELLRIGGEISSIPEAGCDEIYVCAIKHPEERAKIIGEKGIADSRT